MNFDGKVANISETAYIYISAILFVFTLFFRLTNSPPNGDEWVEYYYSQASFANFELFRRVASTFQPPLYNVLMHFWLKINNSLLWFRLFNPLILGPISGVFLFQTVRKLYGVSAACVSLCVLAVCYRWVYCIQDCSEYALMLTFLFAALHFYIDCRSEFSWRAAFAFAFSCVGAIYSQYGSAFVLLPLVALFYFRIVVDKNAPAERKKTISLLYLLFFVTFAAPLYFVFLKRQMAHNELAQHSLKFTLSILKEFPFTMGRILSYFYNLSGDGAWTTLANAVGVGLLIVLILLIVRGKFSSVKRDILMTLLSAYVMHYLLVQLHIYAMVHADQSSGFFARYSYFYIPLFSVALPVAFFELRDMQARLPLRKTVPFVAAAFILCLYLSFFDILGNWRKAEDDVLAITWMENRGWESPTYVIGNEKGFQYYVSHSDGYQDTHMDSVTYCAWNDLSFRAEDFPEKFWLWRGDWGHNAYPAMLNLAKESGYNVILYHDYLAYCSKP